MATTVNLNRVRRVFGESKKSDNEFDKSVSDTALLRQRRMSEDTAKSSLYEDESFYGEENIDPYDSTPKSKRTSKRDILNLSNSNYRTSLLEQLVKNQNNIEMNNTIREYQDKSLIYLENINNILESHFKPRDGQMVDPSTQNQKELTRDVSDLAKAIASLNPGKAGSEFLKGLAKTTGLDEILAPLDMAKDLIVSTIKDGEVGSWIKGQVKEFMISRLPKKHQDYINRFQNDPVILVQDIINKLGIDQNDALSEIFKPFLKGAKIKTEKEKFNASALANFDNKFYYSVTKIIPDQLFKANAFLEKMATGKSPQIQRYNWEENDYESLSDAFKRYMDEHVSNTDATKDIYQNLMFGVEKILNDNKDRSGILARTVKLDEHGQFTRDNNGDIEFSDNEGMKALLSEIVSNKDLNIETFRGQNIDIDKLLKEYKLSTKKVNGKTVNKSEDEIYQLRNSMLLLNRILNHIDPEEATRLDNDMMYYKSRITSQNPFESGGWSSDILKMYSDVFHGNANPEILKNIFGPNGSFNNNGGGNEPTPPTDGGSSGSFNSKKYKNSRGKDVSWEELIDSERKEYAEKEITKSKYGNNASDEVINKKRSKFQYNETAEQAEVRHAFELGILSVSEFTDYKNGLKTYDELKPKLDSLKEASKIYNNLSRLNITADKMHAINPNISIGSYKRMGYLNSAEDIFNNMKNGKLDYEKLSELNSIYSSADLQRKIENGPGYQRRIIDTDDPTGSIERVITSIFSDPIIGKKAGIVAGGAAGLGIGKLLNKTGFIKSPKAGLILGSIGAALMMSERAKNAADSIFGPEGNVKGESGYTNREIFLSKLMTRWLPSLGVGGTVMKGTMSLFSKMGPWGTLIGLPTSLVLGLTAGIMTPKLMQTAQNKMFSKEAREKNTFMSRVGNFLSDLDIPFINKYFMPGEDKSDFEILVDSIQKEYRRASDNVKNLESNRKIARGKDREEIEIKLKEAKKYEHLYETAYKGLSGIDRKDKSNNQLMNEAQSILDILDNKLTEEQVDSRKNLYETMKESQRFNASGAADAKMSTHKSRARRAKELYKTNNETDEDTLNRLNDIENNKVNSAGFKDILDEYENLYANITNKKNILKSDDFNHELLEMLIEKLNKETTDEGKRAKFDEVLEKHKDLKDLILDNITLQNKHSDFYSKMKKVYKLLYPNVSEEDLDHLVHSDMQRMISERKIKSHKGNFLESANASFLSIFSDGINEKDMDALNTIIRTMSGGKGTEGESKLIKMKDLKDVKFKNGSKLSEAGCSVVAFNNALYYIKYPPIEVNSLVSVANNYLTSSGGITSDFFLAMGEKLDLSIKIYNKQDNTFTPKSIKSISPNNIRSLIVLMENTNNDGSHFITIKDIKGDTCIVNDPEVNGLIDMSISTIISRAIEFITIGISTTNSNLKVSKESKTKSQKIASKIANSLPGKLVKGGISIYKKIKSLPKMYDDIKEILEDPNASNIIKERLKNKTSSIFSAFKDDLGKEFGFNSKSQKLKESETDRVIKEEQRNTQVTSTEVDKEIQSSNKEFTPDVVSKNNISDMLVKIYNQINRFFNEPIPVSIYSDQTLALQSDDEAASLALADANVVTGSKLEVSNAKRIKTIRRKRELKKEREESQKVQEAIINQENLIAGVSTGIGGKGTGKGYNGIPGSGESGEAGRVDPENKYYFIPPFIKKIASFGLTKALPFLGASAASVAPVVLAHKASDHLRYNIVEQSTSLFKDATENKLDEEGNVVRAGSYADISGLYRNVRTMKNLYKHSLGLGSLIGKGISKVGSGVSSLLFNKAGDLSTKIANSAGVKKTALTITKKATELASKSFKALGDSGALWSKILGGLNGFFAKVLNASTMLSKVPFVGKYATQIGEMILKMSTSLTKALGGTLGTKLRNKIMEKVMNPANLGKKIPLVGLAITVAMGIASIVNGFRVPDKILMINKEDVTLKHRFQAAAVKFLWDVFPSAISSLISTFSGGVGGIAVDVIVTLLQTLITFDYALENWFHFDEAWRKAQRKGSKDSEEENGKNTQVKIDEENKDIKKIEDKNQKESNKGKNEIIDGSKQTTEQIIKEENETAGVNNTTQGPDVTKEADEIEVKEAKATGASFFSTKNQRERETNTNNSSKPKENKPKDDNGVKNNKNIKSAEKIVEEASKLKLSKTAEEALNMWKNADKNYFHPMGDENTRITSAFGPRNIKNGSSPHKGIDFSSGGVDGKPIYAYKSGKVISSTQSQGLVSIQHPDGTVSRYLHMSERLVKPGQEVSAGDKIGLSGGIGASGYKAFDSHLHFEVKDQSGRNLDPFLALGLKPSVINLTPASRNRENIDYFERYPWLKERDAGIKANLENAVAANSKTDLTKEPPVSKDAGGPNDSGVATRNFTETKELSNGIGESLNKIASALGMKTNSKDDIIVGLLDQLVKVTSQQSQMMSNMVGILNNLTSIMEEKSNNDMYEALKMSR